MIKRSAIVSSNRGVSDRPAVPEILRTTPSAIGKDLESVGADPDRRDLATDTKTRGVVPSNPYRRISFSSLPQRWHLMHVTESTPYCVFANNDSSSGQPITSRRGSELKRLQCPLSGRKPSIAICVIDSGSGGWLPSA